MVARVGLWLYAAAPLPQLRCSLGVVVASLWVLWWRVWVCGIAVVPLWCRCGAAVVSEFWE